jgi:hypothetical protein
MDYEDLGLGGSSVLRPISMARSQNSENRILVSAYLSVGLPVCVERLGSHWTDFHEI